METLHTYGDKWCQLKYQRGIMRAVGNMIEATSIHMCSSIIYNSFQPNSIFHWHKKSLQSYD